MTCDRCGKDLEIPEAPEGEIVSEWGVFAPNPFGKMIGRMVLCIEYTKTLLGRKEVE